LNRQLPGPPGEVTFQAPQRFPSGLAFGLLAGQEHLSGLVGLALGDGDAVEGAVQLPVASAVEPVAHPLARGGG
jgi:hypothetical protein